MKIWTEEVLLALALALVLILFLGEKRKATMPLLNPRYESQEFIRAGITLLLLAAFFYGVRRRKKKHAELDEKEIGIPQKSKKPQKQNSADVMRAFRVPWRLRKYR